MVFCGRQSLRLGSLNTLQLMHYLNGVRLDFGEALSWQIAIRCHDILSDSRGFMLDSSGVMRTEDLCKYQDQFVLEGVVSMD